MNELVGGPAGLPLNVRLQFSKLICTNYVLVSALFSYRPAHRRRGKMPHRVTYFGKEGGVQRPSLSVSLWPSYVSAFGPIPSNLSDTGHLTTRVTARERTRTSTGCPIRS